VLVAQQVSKAEFAGFGFGFLAGVERSVFGTQLLGRIAGHPENVFVSHSCLSKSRENAEPNGSTYAR